MDALRRNFGFATSDWINNSSDYRVADQPTNSNRPRSESSDLSRDSTLSASSSSFNMKSKLVSMWNSVKYSKTLFSLDTSTSAISSQSQVWILAQIYHRKMEHFRQDKTHQDYSDEEESDADAAIRAFMDDFASRIWLTYRRDFKEFQGTTIKSDCGWGCMIRSGQMLVANALLIQHLGRDWRWRHNKKDVATIAKQFHDEESKHRSIIRMFADNPSDTASPFSIHKLVSIAGDVLDKKPGDWFGPASVSHLLKIARDRMTHNLRQHPLLENFHIYVATNTTIYKDDVIDLCVNEIMTCDDASLSTSCDMKSFVEEKSFSMVGHEAEEFFLVQESNASLVNGAARLERGIPGVPHFSDDDYEPETTTDDKVLGPKELTLQPSPAKPDRLYPSLSRLESRESPSASWTPVLILVPVRLGSGNRLNPIYNECIKTLLTEATCVGVIGGRPRHSLYFVGFQDDHLIHLDPHLVQDRVDVFRESCSLDSFHCWTPRKMSLSKMDPSCCLGFLIASRTQFEAWCQIMPELVRPAPSSTQTGGNSSYPMFSIVEGRAVDVEHGEIFSDALRRLESVSSPISLGEVSEVDHSDVEDFVFL